MTNPKLWNVKLFLIYPQNNYTKFYNKENIDFNIPKIIILGKSRLKLACVM